MLTYLTYWLTLCFNLRQIINPVYIDQYIKEFRS